MKNKIHIIIYLLLPISILIADVNEGLLLISDHESDISVLIDINQDEINRWEFDVNLKRSYLTEDSLLIALVKTSFSLHVVLAFSIPTHLSLWAGQLIIPMIGLFLNSNAINVPKSLWPETKLFVPSIGSITHKKSESEFMVSNSSPITPWLGYSFFINSGYSL